MSGIETPTESLQGAYDRGACDLAEWKQAARVEAGLRREYVNRCAELEQALLECRDFLADLKGGAKFEGRAISHADELMANADALLTVGGKALAISQAEGGREP